MCHAGGGHGGTGPEILTVHDQGSHALKREVAECAGTVDAGPDDQHIDTAEGFSRGQRRLPIRKVGRSRRRHHLRPSAHEGIVARGIPDIPPPDWGWHEGTSPAIWFCVALTIDGVLHKLALPALQA